MELLTERITFKNKNQEKEAYLKCLKRPQAINATGLKQKHPKETIKQSRIKPKSKKL